MSPRRRERMGPGPRPTHGTRERQLAALDSKLLRIGLVLLVGMTVYLVLSGRFSLSSVAVLAAVTVVGLMTGRTIGRFMFLRRE